VGERLNARYGDNGKVWHLGAALLAGAAMWAAGAALAWTLLS